MRVNKWQHGCIVAAFIIPVMSSRRALQRKTNAELAAAQGEKLDECA